jgi:protein gp37
MKNSKIGWTHHTINFWLGCEKVSKECQGCYAEALMKRRGEEFNILRTTRGPWFEADRLNAAAKAKNSHELVFTCSLSDFFHEQSDPWRDEAWEVIRRSKNLIWLILTKRPENIKKCLPRDWDSGRGYPHVWLGTTCGVQKTFERVEALRSIPCTLRFLSCEPLLEDISNIDLTGIGWVLCGGMSGKLSKKMAMNIEWAAALYRTAQAANVPFLFKQVSHQGAERGINALGLYLAEQIEGAPLPDPATVDCVREYPDSDLFFWKPEAEGQRFKQGDWDKYRHRLPKSPARTRRNPVKAESPETHTS